MMEIQIFQNTFLFKCPKFVRRMSEVAEVFPKLSRKENKGNGEECTATNKHIVKIAALARVDKYLLLSRRCSRGKCVEAATSAIY